MRHSEATEVSIELNKETEQFLTMRVKDNGKGISEEAISDKKSLGLLGMRERILLLGGKFQIKGLPGKGTEIEVIISV
jgi:signal transduction histidine kinase